MEHATRKKRELRHKKKRTESYLMHWSTRRFLWKEMKKL